MHNTSFVTKSRRHRQETTSVKELNARLKFLYSRMNSQSDPAIQSLIKRTKEARLASQTLSAESFHRRHGDGTDGSARDHEWWKTKPMGSHRHEPS